MHLKKALTSSNQLENGHRTVSYPIYIYIYPIYNQLYWAILTKFRRKTQKKLRQSSNPATTPHHLQDAIAHTAPGRGLLQQLFGPRGIHGVSNRRSDPRVPQFRRVEDVFGNLHVKLEIRVYTCLYLKL